MSIADHQKIKQIKDARDAELDAAREKFSVNVQDIQQERDRIEAEARRALEQRAIQKISKDIYGNGK